MKKILYLNQVFITLILCSQLSFGQAPNLGVTANFAAFTAVGAFSNLGASVVKGDVGTNAGAYSAFPPGTLVGISHVADATSLQAATDVVTAYDALTTNTCGATPLGVTFGNNSVLTAGVYCVGSAATFNGMLTLDGQGNAGALFIFKIGGALTTNTLSNIVLTNGASWSNVYWQINGQVDIAASSLFRGTILANGPINLFDQTFLEGRALSRAGAISLNNSRISNSVAVPLPVTLISFTAKAMADHTVDINWATSLEVDNKGFVIERSKNMIQFEKAGEGRETTANSNSLRKYSLIDRTPYMGTSYYRLIQTDLSGKSTIYPAVSVIVRDDAYGVFPNPITTGGQFTLRLDEPETALVSFYSMDGRLIPLQKVSNQTGSLLLKTSGKVPMGVYILTVSERGQTRNHRMIVD
ncbi:ice-binding family protein [Runella sp.]|uniref:ice-binding family protein n=1 Tax=Runella sp. TaxID=1960881 RepID=UPI003D131235